MLSLEPGRAAGDSQRGIIRDALPPWDVRWVGVIAGVTTVVLCLRAGRYGYFGDELYFLSAGRHLAMGYADQGPLVPLLARVAGWIAPESVIVLRIPSIVCAVAAIWVCAALAREFGGGRGAQRVAALAYATSPFLITAAATLSTFAIDATLSAGLLWILMRWSRIRDDRLLLGAAVLAVVDMQVKLLIPVLGAGIMLGVFVFGPRAVFRRPLLWAAIAMAGLSTVPSLWWQLRHGWPQLAMGPVIAAEQRAATGGAGGLPMQWALLLGVLGGPVAAAGLWALLRSPALRPYRFAAVAVLVQALFVMVTDSRPYYLAGLFPVLLAAGAVWYADRDRRMWLDCTGRGLVVVSMVIASAVVVLLPLPASSLREPADTQRALSLRMRLFGVSGWEELVSAVDAAVLALDPDTSAHVVLVAQNYWQAAALDELGVGLPPVYSPNRGFAYFGSPPETATTVLYVGANSAETPLRQTFSEVRPILRLDAPLGFPGITRHVVIWRCDHPLRRWSDIWPDWHTTILDSGEGIDR
ncbi:glycosyltransferase family 39 protein [Nocardia sp. NBC_01327]|uniref:glycosyltransferase family 39 protein n=1 Tax=Nocardia sp. NBC_01327 TaxID=2903593 RepID=UPI002E0D66B1|nr:glycosyltransferase family 39 protein [Nocardia sp. NBC_01327]